MLYLAGANNPAGAKRSRSAGAREQARGSKKMPARRDFEALCERPCVRRKFTRGKRQVHVAAELEVSAQTASRWYRAWQAGGRSALAGAGRAGRLPRLFDEQIAEVEAALTQGPKANGYPTDMWTLTRVAEVIEKVAGVRYATTQTRASCETGWAGAGMHDHLNGQPVLLIWDGLPAHRSRAMKAGVTGQRHWLTVQPLPGYAYELNPIEQVWGNVKAREVANLCPDTIDEAHTCAQAGLQRVGTNYQLCFRFLDHAGLSL